MTTLKPQKAQIKQLPCWLALTNLKNYCNTDEAPQNSSSQNLTRKVKNWRDWTYTDGSLQKNDVRQDTGSGVYHPHSNVSHYVNPKGMGITNTISSAELAAIAAAVIHGYSHIATDSLTSLHQIQKQLSHPNLHRHHIQGDVLQSIAKEIRQSPSPIHFFKVKSHAGIIGNKHVDVIRLYISTILLRSSPPVCPGPYASSKPWPICFLKARCLHCPFCKAVCLGVGWVPSFCGQSWLLTAWLQTPWNSVPWSASTSALLPNLVSTCCTNGYGVRFAAPPITLLSWRSAALCCRACQVGLCVCLVFEAGRSLMDCLLLFTTLALLVAYPFSCLPPLTCVSGLMGSDVSLSWQRLQKGGTLEIQTVVDSTYALKNSSHNIFKNRARAT